MCILAANSLHKQIKVAVLIACINKVLTVRSKHRIDFGPRLRRELQRRRAGPIACVCARPREVPRATTPPRSEEPQRWAITIEVLATIPHERVVPPANPKARSRSRATRDGCRRGSLTPFDTVALGPSRVLC